VGCRSKSRQGKNVGRNKTAGGYPGTGGSEDKENLSAQTVLRTGSFEQKLEMGKVFRRRGPKDERGKCSGDARKGLTLN